MDPLHTDAQVLDDQLEHIYNRSVRTQDVVWKTSWGRWRIKTDGKSERESERERENDDYEINIQRVREIKREIDKEGMYFTIVEIKQRLLKYSQLTSFSFPFQVIAEYSVYKHLDIFNQI